MSAGGGALAGDGRPAGGSTEIVCALGDGRRLTLYEPVGPARCDRCAQWADDICFALREPDGSERHGGLCAACLAEVLPL
jgi:hypothetical protein